MFFYELEVKGSQKNISSLKFESEKYNLLRCKISMELFTNSSAALALNADELAFMKYKQFDYLNLRMYFVIEGLQPDNYVESNYGFTTISPNEGIQ